MNKKVVYTVLTNNYESPAHIAMEEGWDYVCLTDSDTLSSDQWTVRKIPEWVMQLPHNKRQRIVKIMPHLFFKEYDISLYIDANVKLVKGKRLDDYVNEYLSESVIAIPTHPNRNCVYDEASAVIMSRKDTTKKPTIQMDRYKSEGMPKKFGLWETNIMFRRHNDPECIELMTKWALELLMGSHRDQLSISYASYTTGIKISSMPKNTRSSGAFKCDMRHRKTPAIKKPAQAPKPAGVIPRKASESTKKKVDAINKLHSRRVSHTDKSIMNFITEQ